MKKLFSLLALTAFAALSAQQYYPSYNYQNSQGSDYYNGNTYGNYRSQGRVLSDQEITKKIHDKLSGGWYQNGFTDITFRVNNGTVTLQGTVKSPNDKHIVEEDVWGIDGVKRVQNDISVTTPSTQSNFNQNENQKFNANSRNYMTYNYNNSNSMAASYNDDANSNAMFNQNARGDTTASEATANANDFSESDLKKSEKDFPQDTASTPQDRQINAKIRDQISGGWFSKGFKGIALQTSNGNVTVTGTVNKDSDLQKLNTEIKKIDGVRSVNVQATVR